jgi:predicted DNA-binding transcriptional regulator YafY
MLANPDISVAQTADRLGVSPATLYRYIPAARTANLPSARIISIRKGAPDPALDNRQPP